MNLAVAAKVVTTDAINKQFLPGEIGAVLDWQVRDSDGKIVSSHIRKSESYVRQFLDLLLLKFSDVNMLGLPVLDTSDATLYLPNSPEIFYSDALANNQLYGIIVGTGNTAPDISDNHIETIIAHGVGAGQMSYGAVTFGAPASDATTSQFTITRNFANGSGGAITVNEIALYVKAVWSDPIISFQTAIGRVAYFMVLRDVIAGGIAVANGQTLTVNYRPQAVV